MSMKKKSFTLICILLVITLLTSCGVASVEEKSPFAENAQFSSEGGVVAHNDKYQLVWDSERNCLLMANANQEFWGSIPYESYLQPPTEGLSLINLNSSIIIKYSDVSTGQLSTLSSYVGVNEDGRISTKKIKDGVRVEYYFDGIEIMVPVEYVLMEHGLEARLIVSDIIENEFLLTRVGLLPYMACAKNNTDSFVFVPSGSGAIMSVSESLGTRNYCETVYGIDGASTDIYKDENTESIKLPVFAVKNEKNTVVGIINKGAEKAWIEAQAGNADIGYASAYASFQIHGEQEYVVKKMSGESQIITVYSHERISDDYVSVAYYPLDKNNGNLAGIADCYRNYLLQNGLEKSQNAEPLLYMNLIGGTMVTRHILGIPYTSMQPTTTLSQAVDIVNETKEFVKDNGLLVNLEGFGKGGLDATVIAGGMKLDSRLGSVSNLKKLLGVCENQSTPIFFDFEVIKYAKSGVGYSKWSDAAQTANGGKAETYKYRIQDNEKDSAKPTEYFINREKLLGVSSKLLRKTKKLTLSGVSFGSLGQVAYSDYSKSAVYGVKHEMPTDAKTIINEWQTAGKKVLVSAANDYAAAEADYILASPTKSSLWDAFEQDVPFYQMVFKGYVPLSCSPLNLAGDMRKEFLVAMQTGCGISFSTYNTYNYKLRNSQHSVFASGEYSSLKDSIESFVNEAAEFHKAVSGAVITDYSRQGDLSCTRFDNGIQIYVNFSDKSVQTPLGTIEGMGFLFNREG